MGGRGSRQRARENAQNSKGRTGEESEKAAAEEEKAAKAADKAREASIAAKVEHIQKMRAEHKKKAGHEYAELDKSKKEEDERKDKERVDIWGVKDGAAGAAVRNTVDVELDDAKAAEEEKIHEAKTSERDGKTKMDAKLVKEAGAERSTKTEREHHIEVEEKKLRVDKQEIGRKEAAEKKK